MQELKKEIDSLIKKSHADKNIISAIKKEKPVAPFSTENKLLAYLLSINEIDFDIYSALYESYYKRCRDYLYLFDMAPRTFGKWGEQHIKELFPEFTVATPKNLKNDYKEFDGEFDLWIDGIRVEVKACRANSNTSKGSLSSRAYSHKEALEANFKYHFQQLKPSCCDIFIWIGVCKDVLIYWVLTSEELQKTGKLGSQHRNENTGIKGAEVFEGQVFMTEKELQEFCVSEKDILSKVKEKGKRNKHS